MGYFYIHGHFMSYVPSGGLCTQSKIQTLGSGGWVKNFNYGTKLNFTVRRVNNFVIPKRREFKEPIKC